MFQNVCFCNIQQYRDDKYICHCNSKSFFINVLKRLSFCKHFLINNIILDFRFRIHHNFSSITFSFEIFLFVVIMFQFRINAFKYELTHSKIENICNAKFCSRDNLKKHQKKIHKVSNTIFVRCTFSFNVSTTLFTRTTIFSNAQTTSIHFSIISSLQQSIVKSHDSTIFFHVFSKSTNNSKRNDEIQSQMIATIDIDEHF